MQRMRRHGKEAWAGERMPLSGVGLTRKKLDDCENWTPGGVTVRGQAHKSGDQRQRQNKASSSSETKAARGGRRLAGGVLEV